MEVEVGSLAQTSCQFAYNLPIASRFSWQLNGLVVLNHAPLQAGDSTLILCPHIAGQHDIRQLCCLGEEEIGDNQQIESSQRPLDGMLVGERNHEIRANHEAGPYFLTQHGGNHQGGGITSVW